MRPRKVPFTQIVGVWIFSFGWLLCLAILTKLPTPVAEADVVFRVPEVLVRHAAAQRAVGTGRSNNSRVNESEPMAAPDALVVRYEEFFIEHDVSTGAAKRAANELKLYEIAASRPGCGTCSHREVEYCETRILADHCCCERRFVEEPFPWLPHTCYLGAHRCRPYARDCAQYARLRDCCCYRKLAERWKSILSGSTRFSCMGSCCLTLLAALTLLLGTRL